VPLGHRQQLASVHAVAGAFAHQRSGGLSVAVAGSGGHRQPQPGAHRGQLRQLGRLVALSGGVPGRGSPAVWVAVLLGVVVGWRLDRQMPGQALQGAVGRRLGVPPRAGTGEGSWGRQERASATIARALATYPSLMRVRATIRCS
jgi:hypothetical protein